MLILHSKARGAAQPTVHVGDIGSLAGELVAAAIHRLSRHQGRCRLGLAGGTTPAPVYAYLRAHLPQEAYNQLVVTWTDERMLPASPDKSGDWQAFSADHNLRGAYEHWLGQVPLRVQQVYPMTLGGDARTEAVRFGREFAREFQGGLDIAMLGVGSDGHIASLFPQHPALELDDLCLLVHDSPKAPAERLTLSLPTLNRARLAVVVATGKDKGRLLAEVLQGKREDLPIARLVGGEVHWVVDAEAGREIAAAVLG